MSKRPSKSVSDNVRKSGEALEVETGATGLGVEKTAGGGGGFESWTEAGFVGGIRSALPLHASDIVVPVWIFENPSDSEAAFSAEVGIEESETESTVSDGGGTKATLPEECSAGAEWMGSSDSRSIPEFPESVSTSVSTPISLEVSDSDRAHSGTGISVRKTGTPFEEDAYENSSATILKGSKSRKVSSSLFSVILL